MQEQRRRLDEQAADVAARTASVHEREGAVTAREEEAARREAELRGLADAASDRDAHANSLMQQLQADRATAEQAAAEIAVRPSPARGWPCLHPATLLVIVLMSTRTAACACADATMADARLQHEPSMA